MKKLSIIALLLCASAVAVKAQQPQYVRPHITADGNYVSGYYRTQRDNTPNDNYTYRGNYNPYTGAYGTNQATQNVYGQQYYQGRPVVNIGGRWYYANQ